MNSFLRKIRVEWLVTLFCAWHAADLVHAWRHSPYDRLGWLAMIIWVIPAGWAIGRGAHDIYQFKLAMISLALALIGVIGDLNFLVYWGLAGALGSLAHFRPRAAWLWLALAGSWMPALGWLGSETYLGPITVNGLRVALAVLAAVIGWRRLVTARPGPTV